MERSFYNDDFDFEQLIKQKSDQYKLYPSDRVWKGIHSSIHSTRKWYWLSFVLFIAGISYFTIDQLTVPPAKNIAASKNKGIGTPEKNVENAATILPFVSRSGHSVQRITTEKAEKNGPVIALNDVFNYDLENRAYPEMDQDSMMQDELVVNLKKISSSLVIDNGPIMERGIRPVAVPDSYLEKGLAPFYRKENTVEQIAPALSTLAEEKKAVDNLNELNDEKRVNWLQENALYEFSRPKLKRLSWQIAISPTINYRNLTGNKNTSLASEVKNIPINFNIEGDADKLVNHKPAIGIEVGSMLLYKVNKNLTFKSGLQFNYSRYNIQAYSSNITDRATITLTNFYGTNADSITTFTRLRNFGGNAVKDLKNDYYQLSVPVGIELLVLGRGRLQLSVAGTIQPTYLINRDKYLITSDYKNYTHQPSLVRRFNVNTGAEAFISYKAAGFKFQLGPQLRYQLLSSYDDKYPVKEFLTEYGIKFGISKTIR